MTASNARPAFFKNFSLCIVFRLFLCYNISEIESRLREFPALPAEGKGENMFVGGFFATPLFAFLPAVRPAAERG